MTADFRHLRYFVATAELLHMGRAAERLGIAQPALSQQIKALENRLGVPLFVRRKRHIELSNAGVALLPEARAALLQADRALLVAQRAGRGEVGVIEISYVGSAMLERILPRALRAYLGKHPDVELRLSEIPVQQQIEGLQRDVLDLAMVRGPVTAVPEAFQVNVLSRQRMVAVVSKGSRFARAKSIALAELANEPYVMLDDPPDAGFSSAVSAMCGAAGFEPRVAVTARGLSTVIGLVAAGLGVSLVPASMQSIKLEGALFRPIADDAAITELLMVHRRFERSAATRALVDMILRHAAEQDAMQALSSSIDVGL